MACYTLDEYWDDVCAALAAAIYADAPLTPRQAAILTSLMGAA